MAEGKTNTELILEKQLRILLAEERMQKRRAGKIREENTEFLLQKEDLVKGIIIREILGPPKALEG